MENITPPKDRDLAPGDISRLVSALLDGIARGELAASEREVDFLRSVAKMLPPTSNAA